MTHHIRSAALVALLLAATSLAGCYQVFVPIQKKLWSPRIDANVIKLEKEHKALEGAYKRRVARFRKQIAEAKADTDAALKAGDLSKGMASLVKLYSYTHPCGERSCDSYPPDHSKSRKERPRVNGYEAMIEREGIDIERAFLLDATERAYKLAETYRTERKFNEADVVLARHLKHIPGPPENTARFKARHAAIKQSWLDTLVNDAKAARDDHPAAAMIMVVKARKLAQQQGKAEVASGFNRDISALRAEAIRKARFTIATSSVRGPHAGDFLAYLKGRRWDGEVAITSGSAKASLTIETRSPSYSRSTGSTTGSFRYKASTKTVTNPAWKSEKESCDRRQRSYESNSARCTTNSAGDPTRECSLAKSDKGWLDRCRQQLSRMKQTIQQDVFATQDYPVTLHHLDASMGMSASVRPASGSGWRAASHSASRVRLTDREHDAHSRKGSGVSRDPASPPTERAGLSSLKSKVNKDLEAMVMKGFESYRASILFARTRDKVATMDHAVTYALLRPSTISKEAASALVKATGMDDAVALVRESGK